MFEIQPDLQDDAAVLFQSLVEQNPHLTSEHHALLGIYCQTVSLLKLTEEQIAAELGDGADRSAESDGDDTPEPLLHAIDDLRKTAALLASELGLGLGQGQGQGLLRG